MPIIHIIHDDDLCLSHASSCFPPYLYWVLYLYNNHHSSQGGVRGARKKNDGKDGDFARRMETMNGNAGGYRSHTELFGRKLIQKDKWKLISDKVGYVRFVSFRSISFFFVSCCLKYSVIVFVL
jgi:hypothetical protein